MIRRTLVITLALILSLTAVAVSSTQAQAYCMSVSSRLYVGAQGRVTPGLPNVLRAEPVQGNGNAIFAYIPAGGFFYVVGGPACSSGITWWLVTYNGVTGWTPEGQWNTYWTEPAYTPTPVPTNPVCGVPRLTSGMIARVTPGLPNRLRSNPGYNGYVLGYIPGGAYFTVLSQAAWANGSYWYQVNYNGLIGWTAEGRGCTYWLEPA